MNVFEPRIPSPLQELRDDRLADRGVRLWLKRDDLIHPDIPGNKYRKLKYNITAAREQGASTLLTFGGAYSNHLRATAAAGALFGFDTVGIVRGEEHLPLNDSLRFCVDHGMRLQYMDRETYRHKTETEILDPLRDKYNNPYLLPEGGSNTLAVKGCAEIAAEIDIDFDHICCPVGTGGTLAGVAAGLRPGQHATGFSVLKGGGFLNDDVARLQREAFGHTTDNWHIEVDYHFGGYAKRKPPLDDFIVDFYDRHGLTLDWIYVAKMMSGLLDGVRHGAYSGIRSVVCLITG
jgi:1-aminocyclopropane-1-carboxylate deaminase